MYLILSPAKKLNDHRPLEEGDLRPTQPLFIDRAEQLVGRVQELNFDELKSLMSLSDNLTTLNQDRFSRFSFPFNEENASAAVHRFAGDTYVGLQAADFTEADLEFAQEHLGILSGLYGLLRPLDLIQPYRLEMGTKLSSSEGKNLYEFWVAAISEKIMAAGHQVVINLASKEYFSAVKASALEAEVITPVFKEERAGKLKIISFSAKRARGMMARFAVKNKLSDPELLKSFSQDGYSYHSDLSSEREWLFVR
jgi:uncharacterized protein